MYIYIKVVKGPASEEGQLNTGLLGQLRRAITMIPALLLLGLSALVAPSLSYSCYGDISALQAPTISCTPVRASGCAGYAIIRRTAEADLPRLRRYEIPIKRVARNLCLEPALIGAIMSQESRVGLLLDNGWDRARQKYGLMQISRQQVQPSVMWDSEEHINQCSNILVLSINEVRARHPTWSWDRQLRGGICTYHAKMGNVQVYEADPCSNDYNYVNSVIRRAQYFKRNGF